MSKRSLNLLCQMEQMFLDDEGEVTIDTEKMREALSFYQNLSQYTMPGSNDVTEIKDAFMNGTAPMAIYSTYILPSVYEAGTQKISVLLSQHKKIKLSMAQYLD